MITIRVNSCVPYKMSCGNSVRTMHSPAKGKAGLAPSTGHDMQF